jgi:hypothetical protein
MEQLELGAPIATLRSLGALSEGYGSGAGHARIEANRSSADPIANGILTEQEASRAFRMWVASKWKRFVVVCER